MLTRGRWGGSVGGLGSVLRAGCGPTRSDAAVSGGPSRTRRTTSLRHDWSERRRRLVQECGRFGAFPPHRHHGTGHTCVGRFLFGGGSPVSAAWADGERGRGDPARSRRSYILVRGSVMRRRRPQCLLYHPPVGPGPSAVSWSPSAAVRFLLPVGPPSPTPRSSINRRTRKWAPVRGTGINGTAWSGGGAGVAGGARPLLFESVTSNRLMSACNVNV